MDKIFTLLNHFVFYFCFNMVDSIFFIFFFVNSCIINIDKVCSHIICTTHKYVTIHYVSNNKYIIIIQIMTTFAILYIL